MATNFYAVEVESKATTFDNANFGITKGFFRYITDRPDFNGTDTSPSTIPTGDNSVIKINLDGLESIGTSFQSGQIFLASNGIFKSASTVINVGDRFTVLDTSDFTGGELAAAKGSAPAEGDLFEVTNNTGGSEAVTYAGINKWFEDFITKRGMSNPNRRTDISHTGDYGTLSGFKFRIDNSIIAGTDTPIWQVLRTNNVFLPNKKVRVWAVIGGVFNQIWAGRVNNNPMTETDFSFICKSDHKAIHKNFPPDVIDEEAFPDARDESRDKPIPVCFGEVEFAKLFNSDGDPSFLILNKNPLVPNDSEFAMASQYVEAATDPRVQLEARGHPFVSDDTELVDSYLFVIVGDAADTERGIRITGSFGVAPNLVLELAEPLIGFLLGTHGFAVAQTQKETWLFKIAKLGTTNLISAKAITIFKLNSQGLIQIFNYNTNTGLYEDVKYTINSTSPSTSPATINILSTNITKAGEFSYAVAVPVTMTNLVIAGGSSAGPSIISGSVADIQDFDRSTGVIAENTSIVGDIKSLGLSVDVKLDINNTNNKLDDIWFGVDAEFVKVAGGDLGAYRIRYFLDFFDLYDRQTGTFAKVIEYPDPSGSTGTDPANFLNTLPNEYYKIATSGNGDNSEDSHFGQIRDASFGVIGKAFQLDDDIVSQIKAGSLASRVRVTVLVTTAAGFGSSKIKLTLNEIGFWSTQKVDLNDNNIYTRVSGEKTTGSAEANNVYRAFQLMLETYDLIASNDIDFGNLPTKRNDWFVGRQVMEKKGTFDYIKELAENSFVAVFNTRKGKLGLSAWRDRTDTPHVHDETTVVRGSITNWKLTRLDRLSNTFTMFFSPDPGGGKFFSQLQIKNVDGGTTERNAHPSELRSLWDIANAAFKEYGTIREFRKNLKWFNDRERWYNTDDAVKVGVGKTERAAFKFLQNAVEWLTRQHRDVTYKIPMDATNVLIELTDPVKFGDTIYTNDVNLDGNIYLLEYDLSNDQIKVGSLIEPNDTIPEDFADIEETGSAPDTITESGSQPDTITEDGV